MISSRRLRCCEATGSIGHQTQACSCAQGGAVGAPAGAQFDLVQLEVLLELVLLLRGFSAFRGRAVSAPGGEKCPAGLDQLLLEDR